jgi:hypothetical protein
MLKKNLFFFIVLCAALPVNGGNSASEASKGAAAVRETVKEEKKTDPQEIRRIKESEIDEYKKKQGKTLYVGEGVSEVKDDLGEAIRVAKERAMADLLKSIKVRIKADVRDELKYSEDGVVGGKFESIVNSYVDQVLEIVQDKQYLDYPTAGTVTKIVYVDKDAYDEKVAKDMQVKTERIKKFAVEGIKAQNSRKIAQAIENYVNGKLWQKNYFEDLPVKADVQGNGNPEDLGAYFDTKLTQILNSIKLDSPDENIVYNTDGKVNKKPMVILSYEDASGKTPLENIPLKASFVKGGGSIPTASIRTGRRGEVYIPVDKVDPSEREAEVQVELDADAFKLKDVTNLPTISVVVRKSKAVAWAVSFFREGKNEKNASFAESVKIILNAYGYELKNFEIGSEDLTDEKIAQARELNVDYLIYVCATASTGADEYGMYKSSVSSKAYIYSFYDDKLVEMVEGPSKSGYSAGASGAAAAALSKVKPGLMEMLKEKIKVLK